MGSAESGGDATDAARPSRRHSVRRILSRRIASGLRRRRRHVPGVGSPQVPRANRWCSRASRPAACCRSRSPPMAAAWPRPEQTAPSASGSLAILLRNPCSCRATRAASCRWRFRLDGARLASGSLDGTARVWDTNSVAQPAVIQTTRVPSGRAALSPDGKRLISGGADRSVRLWDLGAVSQPPTVLEGNAGSIWAVSFSHDGSRAAAAGDDSIVRVWDVRTPGGRRCCSKDIRESCDPWPSHGMAHTLPRLVTTASSTSGTRTMRTRPPGCCRDTAGRSTS